jgi:cell division cycle 14
VYTGDAPEMRTNCAFLLGAYLVVQMQMTPEEAWRPFDQFAPTTFCGFRDATLTGGDFPITILDCLRGLFKCMETSLYVPHSFDPSLYDYYDNPRNGDLHIVVPGKFIAFKGPTVVRGARPGIMSHTPGDYIQVFKSLHVAAVVRLNSVEYDRYVCMYVRMYVCMYACDGCGAFEWCGV